MMGLWFGAMRLRSRAQEFESAVQYSFSLVPPEDLPLEEVSASLGELANLPTLFNLMSPLGTHLAA